MAETPYVETEALLAVMNEDSEELAKLLKDMLPNERQALAQRARYLANSADIGRPFLGLSFHEMGIRNA